MTALGVQTFDEKSEETLSITDRLTRVRWMHTADAGETGSINLPDIAGKKGLLLSHSDSHYPHVLTRTGTLLEWSGAFISKLALVLYT